MSVYLGVCTNVCGEGALSLTLENGRLVAEFLTKSSLFVV